MQRHPRILKTFSRTSPASTQAFTLVEVIVALAILSVLVLVAGVLVQSAARGITRSLDEARWNTTLLQFDRFMRRTVAELPASFWGPAPTVTSNAGGCTIEELADGGNKTIALELSKQEVTSGARTLTVKANDVAVLFRGITGVRAEPVTTTDGRSAGVRITLSAPGHEQDLIINWSGGHL